MVFNKLVPSSALALALWAVPAAAQDDGTNDVIVVRGAFIPDEKKSTSEISSLLDAEDFERAGDSDIAAALRRVTGLSIQDGRFVVVRGLNERYSSATLNGLPLPSPEPLRRAAPLDLFPTSVIESTLVQKTFSPQYSGEFGGGLVELRSKSIPNEDFMEVSLGFSVNDETTMQSGLFYEGSNTDIFGFDDGLRDIPTGALALLAGSVDSDTQNAIDTSFDQRDTLLIQTDDAPANGSGSLALGKRFYSEGDMEIGTVLYVGYGNDWETRDGERFRLEGVNSAGTDFFQTRQEVTVSGMSSTGIDFNSDHSVQATGLLVRKSLKSAEISTTVADENEFLQERTDFIERQLWQGQLTGQHLFAGLSDLEMGWKLSYGEAERDQPYNRQTSFRFDESAGEYGFTTEGRRSYIEFNYLKDENLAGGLDFVLPLDFDMPVELKFGGSYADNTRATERRFFFFDGDFPTEIQNSRADLIYSDEVLGLTSPNVRYFQSALEPDNFEGNLEVLGAYAGADFELGETMRAALGVRFEDSTQETETFLSRSPADIDSFAPIEEEYFLPSVTLTWNPVGNFQLRGAYSETITRPQFRELSPSIFTDPDTDVNYAGNPFLVNTEITSFDARAEWYFNRGEFATIGVFYKDMANPIEEAVVSEGEAVRTTFINAPSAELFGAEAEFEKNFDLVEFFGSNALTDGNTLVFKTNYTFTSGEVSDDGTITVANRSGQGVTAEVRDAASNILDGSRLAGLSEHLFNLQAGIETSSDAKITLAVNYASERTLIRGEAVSAGRFLPSVVEQPPIMVDFIIDQPLSLFGQDGFKMTLKIQNLLNEKFDAFYEDDGTSILDGEQNFQTYDRGRTLSMGLKKSF